jgi:hypothetical protein
MNGSAWAMLAVAVLLLGGGLATCIRIALVVDRRKREEGITFQHEGDD